MACEGCNQKIIEANAAKINTRKEAQETANRSGEWVGIYYFQGETFFAIGPDTVGKPITEWVTPQLQDTTV